MGWIRLQPQALTPAYLLRIIALRALLLGLSLVNQGVNVIHLATAAPLSSQESWRPLLALQGLQLQLLVHVLALGWPLVHLTSYERHHALVNQLSLATNVAGKVVEVLCGPQLPFARPQLFLVLHSWLFTAYQQKPAAHALQLGGILAAYFVSDVASSTSSYWWPSSRNGTSSSTIHLVKQQQLLRLVSSQLLYLAAFCSALLLHQMLTYWFGPALQQEQQQRPALQPARGAAAAIHSTQATAGSSSTAGQQSASHLEQQQLKAAASRLLVAQSCNTAFMGLVAAHYWAACSDLRASHPAAALPSRSPNSWMWLGMCSPYSASAVTAVACSVLLFTHCLWLGVAVWRRPCAPVGRAHYLAFYLAAAAPTALVCAAVQANSTNSSAESYSGTTTSPGSNSGSIPWNATASELVFQVLLVQLAAVTAISSSGCRCSVHVMLLSLVMAAADVCVQGFQRTAGHALVQGDLPQLLQRLAKYPAAAGACSMLNRWLHHGTNHVGADSMHAQPCLDPTAARGGFNGRLQQQDRASRRLTATTGGKLQPSVSDQRRSDNCSSPESAARGKLAKPPPIETRDGFMAAKEQQRSLPRSLDAVHSTPASSAQTASPADPADSGGGEPPIRPHTAAADTPADNDWDSCVRLEQRMACDALMTLLTLPQLIDTVRSILNAALDPARGADWLAQALACAGALLYGASLGSHVLLVLLRPRLAVARRERLWSLHCMVLPVVPIVTRAILNEPQRPWEVLLVLGATIGLLDVSVQSFGTWVPLLATACFMSHGWSSWQQVSWGHLIYEAMEFNLLPIFLYFLFRLAAMWMHRLQVVLVLNLVKLTGSQRAGAWHRGWALTLALLGQTVLGMLLACVVVLGPSHLPRHLNLIAAIQAARRPVVALLERLWILEGVGRMEGSLAAIAAVGVTFLAVSGVQVLILQIAALRSPRQGWYETWRSLMEVRAEDTVRKLAQLMDQQVEHSRLEQALLQDLGAITAGCFSRYTLLLFKFEEPLATSTDNISGHCSLTLRRYVVQAAPEASSMPREEVMQGSEVPSVLWSARSGKDVRLSSEHDRSMRFADLEALAQLHGMDSFFVTPLVYAQRALGALVVTCSSPVTIDSYLCKLVHSLGLTLGHMLYTVNCEMSIKAGNEILHDVLPEQVAMQLRKRVLNAKPALEAVTPPSRSDSLSTPVTPPWAQPSNQSFRAKSPMSLPAEVPTALIGTFQIGKPAVIASPRGASSGFAAASLPVVYQQWHPAVSVLFADIMGYTSLSTELEPEQVMLMLHELFSKYDQLCGQYSIYKVETIGDCYMAAAGLLVDDPHHAQNLVRFGFDILNAAATVKNPLGGPVRIRVGIHSGRVMSGIVGSIRARYCLFGDTVNTASRMESNGIVDHIQVTPDTYQLLGDLQPCFTLRQSVAVKGKGVMETYVSSPEAADLQPGS